MTYKNSYRSCFGNAFLLEIKEVNQETSRLMKVISNGYFHFVNFLILLIFTPAFVLIYKNLFQEFNENSFDVTLEIESNETQPEIFVANSQNDSSNLN